MPRNSQDALNAPFIRTKRQAKPRIRLCEAHNCRAEGSCRAPKSAQCKEYYFFCTDHAREYNRNWNYFKNMTNEQAENIRRDDILWNRPTSRFGFTDRSRHNKQQGPRNLRDDFGFWQQRFMHQQSTNSGTFNSGASLNITREQRSALATLGLDAPVTKEEVKARFKLLARKLHPDLNPDDPAAEDKLKSVNGAYQLLKEGLDGTAP